MPKAGNDRCLRAGALAACFLGVLCGGMRPAVGQAVEIEWLQGFEATGPTAALAGAMAIAVPDELAALPPFANVVPVLVASELNSAVLLFAHRLGGEGEGESSEIAHVETFVNGEGEVEGIEGAKAVVISPDGLFVYVASSGDGAIARFGLAPEGESFSLTPDGSFAVPGGVGADVSALAVAPRGLLEDDLYAACPGTNSIVHYGRLLADGALLGPLDTYTDGAGGIDGLQGVAALAVSPAFDRLYAVSDAEDAVVLFERNPLTGALTWQSALRASDEARLDAPASVAVSPAGDYVYVPSAGGNALLQFTGGLSTNSNDIGALLSGDFSGPPPWAALNGVASVAVAPALGPLGPAEWVIAASSADNALTVFEWSLVSEFGYHSTYYPDSPGVSGMGDPGHVRAWSDGLGVYVYVASENPGGLAVFRLREDLDLESAVVVVDTASDLRDGDTRSVSDLATRRGNDGQISLGEAIAASNATWRYQRVEFDDAVDTIRLSAPLPDIQNTGLGIDGGGHVVLDGVDLGATPNGLTLESGFNVIGGLAIVNFAGHGIAMTGGPLLPNAFNQIWGCRIGTDWDGTAGLGNGGDGIRIAGSMDNTVGGIFPGEPNTIVANAGSGIRITGASASGNLVVGNYIGTWADGEDYVTGFGNEESGIRVEDGAIFNSAGAFPIMPPWEGEVLFEGEVSGDLGNVIAYNDEYGVRVDGPLTEFMTIRRSVFVENGSGPIALANGANNNIGPPTDLTTNLVGNAVVVEGDVDWPFDTIVEVYAESPSGVFEFAGRAPGFVNGGGNAFAASFPRADYPEVRFYAAATDLDGNTSEFSTPAVFDSGPPVLDLVGDIRNRIECGVFYTPPAATAWDGIDGAVSVDQTDTINHSEPGVYYVSYAAIDNSDNSVSISFDITVEDTSPPFVSPEGEAQGEVTIPVGGTFDELSGIIAYDNCAGYVTDSLTADVSSLDVTQAGTYTVSYAATDGFNVGVGQRTVHVVERPTVTISAPLETPAAADTQYTNQASIDITVAFAVPVTGFEAADLLAENARVDGFAGSGDTYSFLLIPQAQGEFSLRVPADVAQDGNGFLNTASTQYIRFFDTVPPAVEISSDVTSTENGPVVFSVTYTGVNEVTLAKENVYLVPPSFSADMAIDCGPAKMRVCTVTLSNIVGEGDLSISIDEATGSDLAGNFASHAESNTVAVGPAGEAEPSAEGETGSPVLSVAPAGIDFSIVRVGETKVREFLVTNTGGGVLSGYASVSGDFAVVSGRAYSLAADEAQAVSIRFAPSSEESSSGLVTFTGGAGAEVSVRGQGAIDFGGVAGTVRLDDGTGATCAAVVFSGTQLDYETVALTDENGGYQIASIPAGEYTAAVHSMGYASQTELVSISSGQETALDFTLEDAGEGAVVFGAVTSTHSGSSLGGIRVDAVQAGALVSTAYTCADGFYALPVTAKKADLSAQFSGEGYGTETVDVDLESGGDTQVDVSLAQKISLPLGLLGVTVVDTTTSRPVSGARVEASKGVIRETQYTDEAGTLVHTLDVGTYSVRASAAGYLSTTGTGQVTSGQGSSQVDFRLIPGEEKSVGCFAGAIDVPSPPPPASGAGTWLPSACCVALLLMVSRGYRPRSLAAS